MLGVLGSVFGGVALPAVVGEGSVGYIAFQAYPSVCKWYGDVVGERYPCLGYGRGVIEPAENAALR